ncbi:MAG TPA: hypothetical protein EYN06_08860 [Myxococcales bacterium]|nr:hypothetical protein [Myxococcales bacterium]
MDLKDRWTGSVGIVLLVLSVGVFASHTFAQSRESSVQFHFLRLAAPPLAAQLSRAEKGLSSAQQKAYCERLKLEQSALLKVLQNGPIKVLYRYQKVLNGLQVQCSGCTQEELLALPGVEEVHPVLILETHLDNSVPHIGAGSALEAAGIDGQGVNIGIIDSGVDYLHAAFGGLGKIEAYAANDAASIDDSFLEKPLFPTAKVVGGHDFVGLGYVPGQVAAKPDPDPMPDYQLLEVDGEQIPFYADHGTHVAGIAAGIGSSKVSPGVAPGANIWALKVTSLASTTFTTAAIEWASDPNNDGDLSDALDVLNISLGSSFSGREAAASAEAMAITAFVKLGGVVVASAGNSGNIPMVVSVPGGIPEAISVAATRAPGEVGVYLKVESPPSLTGLYAAKPASTKLAPNLDETGALAGDLFFAEQGCSTSNYGPKAEGRIALLERKGCSFGEKFAMAQIAGALGVVVIQNKPGAPIVMKGTPKSDIAGVMIEQDAGQSIREALEAGETVSIMVGNDFPVLPLIDTVWNSSSLGPAFPMRDAEHPIIAKPDISAPGANIDSVLPGPGNEKRVASGTSMAAPHVAGVAALLKQKRPTWSVREIKAALINTANSRVFMTSNPDHGGDGERAPVSRVGGGRVRVGDLLATEVVAYAEPQVAIEFGLQSLDVADTVERSVVISNKGNTARTYSVSFDMRQDGADLGVVFSASTQEVTVSPGSADELVVSALLEPEKWPAWQMANPSPSQSHTQQGNLIRPSEFDGYLVLEPNDDGPTLRVPIYLLVRPVSKIALGTVCLSTEPFVVPLENTGVESAAIAKLFTLVTEDLEDDWSHPSIDVRALGIRTSALKDQALVQFGLSTWAPRIHPNTMAVHVYMDTDLDGLADYILLSGDEGRFIKGKSTGRITSMLLRVEPLGKSKLSVQTVVGKFELVYKMYAETDLMSSNIVLSARLQDLGIDFDNPSFRFWVGTFDLKKTVVGPNSVSDLLPSEVIPWEHLHSTQYYTFSLNCSGWVFDAVDVNLLETNEALVSQAPTCGNKEKNGVIEAPGIMVFVPNKAGPDEALIVRAVDTTPTACPEESRTEVAEGCVGLPDYPSIMSPECGDYITATGKSSLELGLHPLVIAYSDVWGKGGQCETQLLVEDTTGPQVNCPVDWVQVEPEMPLELALFALDHCLDSLQVEAVECVEDSGTHASECSVEFADSIARVSGFDSTTDRIILTVVARDTSGNQTTVLCETELNHPPQVEEGDSGGCRSSSTPHSNSLVWLLLLAPLFLFRRQYRY